MPIYMKYGDIKGDVTEASHGNWIELGSVSWGANRTVNNPGGSTGPRNLSAPRITEVTVSKQQDVSSIPLIQECLYNSDAKSVQIDFVRTGVDQGTVYYTISLVQVVIAAFTQASNGDRPVENLTLNFTKISFSGSQMDRDGTSLSPASYAWSVKDGAPA